VAKIKPQKGGEEEMGREETKETINTKNHEEIRKRKRCNNGPVR
jgi:hypothetical protein